MSWVRRAATDLLSRLKLRCCASVGKSPRVAGRVVFCGGGRVRLGDRVVIDGRAAPVELRAAPGAEIRIGHEVRLEAGVSLEAHEAVTLGDRVRLGRFCKVMDNASHELHDRGRRPPSSPVCVEADAEVGAHAVLLPGTHVERGARVRARSVTASVQVPGRSGVARAARFGKPGLTRYSTWKEAVAGRAPWQALRLILGGGLAVARAKATFRGCAQGRRIHVGGRVRVVNHGRIVLGDRLTFLAGGVPSEIVCHPGAMLAVGPEGFVNYGCSIEATASIEIGRSCMLAPYVRIADRDGRRTAPIVIHDDVWLAYGVIVEPGVTIGRGSIVGAGSVVTRDVPPDSLVVGNPARPVRSLL